MHYKTMALDLLKQKPKKYHQLRKRRMLLEALEFYARQLKMSHEAWLARHFQTRPGRSESQLSSEALEMALQELEDFLYSEQSDQLSVEERMEAAQGPTPPRQRYLRASRLSLTSCPPTSPDEVRKG